ncbi:MAG TPA: tetratricopeptide repeat protein [Acidobacteriota bacterium]
MRSQLKVILPFLCLFSFSFTHAQEKHRHDDHEHENFGNVTFPVSCDASVQEQFRLGVAMLHSFAYEDAEKTFTAVSQKDPHCAMAYWGFAMSLYHPVWVPPDPSELKRGWNAIERAKLIGGKTEREKEYIAAVDVFFRDSDKLDHRTRALAYEKAMERLYRRYPNDREAAVFYSLALLGTALPSDKTYNKQKKAADILNSVLVEAPEHPGVAHYIIHSYDYPQLASLALPAARTYANLAPSSPHALHMPSHIFTRLGLWEESIRSNMASADMATRRVARTQPGTASFDALHALDYLMYAYLQECEETKARNVREEVSKVQAVDVENFAAAYALAAVPARYALERRHWTEAAALQVRPAGFPWNRFPYAEAIIYFARSLGAARSDDPGSARKDLEKLAAFREGLLKMKETYWADQVEVQRLSAAAWLAYSEQRHEESLAHLKSAAELEDTMEKHPVTPGSVLPSRELLGDLLLEMGKPDQALKEFETTLRVAPNRFNSLYGAARSAEQTGDRKKAGALYQRLIELCSRADTVRPELKHAKLFLRSE